jgi:hypothetical protein
MAGRRHSTLAALLTCGLVSAVAPSCFAQKAPPGIAPPVDHAIACRAYPKSTESFKRKLWDGYEISLGPAANATGAGDDACTAAIYNKLGHVVYRTTGFNVSFDENLTGQDFDGDGHGEVVFETDSGGGNHCCWAYNVISLFPRPHKLFDIAMEGAVQFERDDAGRMVIWERVAAPDVFNGPMAGRPFVERVFRARDGKLTDATPEFCARIFGVNSRYNQGWQRDLSTENIAKFASLADPQNQQDAAAANDAVEFIGRSLLERAYQRLLCGDADAAIADLNLWPAASRAKTKAAFASQVQDDFPVFAERLAAEGGSK